jgi:signal transduction histidine kinase
VGATTEQHFDRVEKPRALALGALLLAVVGAADVALGAGGRDRAPVWGAWAALYLLASIAARRVPDRWLRPLGAATSMIAVAALLALCAMGEGAHSTLFLFVPMVPLLSALTAQGDLLLPALQGVMAVAGGVVLLHADRRGWGELAVWAGATVASTAFALLFLRRAEQRQAALVAALRERAEVQAQLADAERRRSELERWVEAGHLADQVAHDVNSPLAALRSNLRFVREELGGADPEILRAVTDGEEAIEEIRASVSSLRVRIQPRTQRPD